MASWKNVANAAMQTVTLGGSGYTSGSGTMVLASGQGANLPTTGDFWLVNNNSGTIRIWKVTARSTDTLTVVPDSSEGAGDASLSAGVTLYSAMTVAALIQLIADITAAAVAASGYVLLEQYTASSSASLNFTTCITSTYDEYMIEFVGVKPATNNENLFMQMSTNGGSSYDSSTIYGSATFIFRAGTNLYAGAGTEVGSTSIAIARNGVSSSANWPGICGSVKLFMPGSSSFYKLIHGDVQYFGDSSQYSLKDIIQGTYRSTTAVNAFKFYFSSGNIASGTIRVYGIKK